MKRNGYHIIAVLLAMMPMLVSCRQELCYDHFPSVDVDLTWEQVWERDYGMDHPSSWDETFYGFPYADMNPDLPEWVNLVKFNSDGTSEDNFLSVSGGHITYNKEKEGSYLLYNGDTEYIVLQDIASLNEARATTTSRSRAGNALQALQNLAPETRTANPPDLLYAAFVKEVPFVDFHEKYHLPVKMQPLVYTYVIRYEFEHGLEHVALARGAIGGMAQSVYLRDGSTSDDTVILLYDCFMTDYGCEAHVRSFGVPSFPDNYYGRAGSHKRSVPVTVNLELMLTSGKYIDFNFNVTDQLENQPRGGVITIKGIRVEDDQNIGGGGAFSVDVTGWGDTVDIELPIGNENNRNSKKQ